MKTIVKMVCVLVLSFSLTTLSSCGATNSLTSGVAPALISKIAPSLMSGISGLSGLGNLGSSLGLGSKLSSILSTASLVSSFKGMLGSKFQIPSTAVDNSFSKFTDLTSVAGFIAKNAPTSLLNGL